MSNPAAAHEPGQNRQTKETIELEGRVIEALPSAVFRIQIEMPAGRGPGKEILAHIAGRLRVNHIRILPGDRVRIELTPYDLTRGRIIRRL